jgi:hypothetical protein
MLENPFYFEEDKIMANYREAEAKTDSLLLKLVRSKVSLLILVATHAAAFVAGALLF